jgi:hypothetical protein
MAFLIGICPDVIDNINHLAIKSVHFLLKILEINSHVFFACFVELLSDDLKVALYLLYLVSIVGLMPIDNRLDVLNALFEPGNDHFTVIEFVELFDLKNIVAMVGEMKGRFLLTYVTYLTMLMTIKRRTYVLDGLFVFGAYMLFHGIHSVVG